MILVELEPELALLEVIAPLGFNKQQHRKVFALSFRLNVLNSSDFLSRATSQYYLVLQEEHKNYIKVIFNAPYLNSLPHIKSSFVHWVTNKKSGLQVKRDSKLVSLIGFMQNLQESQSPFDSQAFTLYVQHRVLPEFSTQFKLVPKPKPV